MAFGSWLKKLGSNIKSAAKDFAETCGRDFVHGFKFGWNKTKSIMEKLPVVGNVAKILPKFDNSNNPALKYFGNDGYIKYTDS